MLRDIPALLHLTSGIGETALHYLAVENDLEGVQWLWSKGSDLNTRNAFGTPALFEVAQLGYKELYDWFVANGADRTAIGKDGRDLVEHVLEFDPHMAEWVSKRGV